MVPLGTNDDNDDDSVPVLSMFDWFSVWSSEATVGSFDLIGTRRV